MANVQYLKEKWSWKVVTFGVGMGYIVISPMDLVG